MSFLRSLDIPLSGLTAERFRLDIISQNVANADDIASNPDDVYKRQMVVFGEDRTFKTALWQKLCDCTEREYILHPRRLITYNGVQVMAVVEDQTAAEPVYDPQCPIANEYGYIYESNVDIAVEQLDAIEAENMYEANLAVFEVVKSMAQSALSIGGR